MLVLRLILLIGMVAFPTYSNATAMFEAQEKCYILVFSMLDAENNSTQTFVDTVENHMKNGYYAKDGVKALYDSDQHYWIQTLFKSDCGASPYMKWFLWSLLPIGIAIVAILAFKFRGLFRSRVHSKV